MADKTYVYVEIGRSTVKEIFESKFKANANKAMDKATEAVVKKAGKLTLDKPKDKGSKGWSLDCSLEFMAPDKAGKLLEGKVSMFVSTWPGKSVKAMPSAAASITIRGADKVTAADVEDLAIALVESAMRPAVKFMEGTKPQ
jgi:hypothetical protein